MRKASVANGAVRAGHGDNADLGRQGERFGRGVHLETRTCPFESFATRLPGHAAIRRCSRVVVISLVWMAGSGAAFGQDPPDLTTLTVDDLLEAEVVYAAARRIQTLREAPSAVSVVTAAEIRRHGYQTLAAVLRSLPSFYVTDDRHYSYVGVRGFDRPGDYGARVLLLLNGLRTNDNLYEQAYVGQEFLVDIDLVERIEVVRGPSAAIYGSSAFFAVVNVVTRHGRDLQGGELSGGVSSFDTRGGRATYGRRLDSGLEFLVSASRIDSGGQRLYFKEFDAPETGHGIADRLDDERSDRALVIVSKGNVSFEASHVSRDKGIPTGVYGTVFGDPRTRTTDAKDLVSLNWARSSPTRASEMVRLHYGFFDYHGSYAFQQPDVLLNDDSARGEWCGVEANAVRALGGRHLVSAGVELEDNFSQRQLNFDVASRAIHQDSRNHSGRVALFVQDQVTLSKRLTVHAGLREDWYSTFGYEMSPRLALVYDDGRSTTLKLLHGRAFRAPNDFELHYTGPVYKTNPDLGPEKIRTTELVLEQRLGRGLRLSGSGYVNALDNLISLAQDPADERYFYRNAGRSDSVGAEVGLEVKHSRGPSGRLSYAWQRSREHDTRALLTNSPRHMAKAEIAWPLFGERLIASADGWYMSARTTLAGAQAGPALVGNLTLLAPRIRGRFEVSTSLYNVFDERYADPGSQALRQDLIPRDGRNFRLEVSYKF
jgi:outer membrane receptor protein involved in Fe transport